MAKQPTKAEIQRDKWIADTQMFQRIAKVPETPYADLAKEWDSFKTKKRRDQETESVETHIIISRQAGDQTT